MWTRPHRTQRAKARATSLPLVPRHRRTPWTSSSPLTSPCAREKGKTVNVAYNPSGSGDGRTQFIAGQIDFAGSDSAIKDEQADKAKERCVGGEAWNLPLVFGPIAVAYNLDGVDKLVLNAEVLAKIFNGGITKWNDPAIAALNSGASLPDEKITTVIRSDSSGTTDNFQKYLDAASNGAWDVGRRVRLHRWRR